MRCSLEVDNDDPGHDSIDIHIESIDSTVDSVTRTSAPLRLRTTLDEEDAGNSNTAGASAVVSTPGVGKGGGGGNDCSAAAETDTKTTTTTTKIRMLEFFSGIGGMRISLEKALQLLNNDREQETRYVLESCRAYDISLHANNVYRHNFCSDNSNNHKTNHNNNNNTNNNNNKGNQHSHSVCTKLVEQLTTRDICGFGANLWTMSPPCQPFTTNGEGRGKQRLDASDKRCNGLKGIARLLDEANGTTTTKPNWILLENVRGFGTSVMCQLWCDCLSRNGYSYRSFLLSPVEFGIPNHRSRYYILAELNSKRWGKNSSSGSNNTKEDATERKPSTNTVHGITALSKYDAIAKRPLHKVGRYVIGRDRCRSPPSSSSSSSSEAADQPEEHKDNDASGVHGVATTTSSSTNTSATALDDPCLVPKKILSKAWAKGLGVVSENDTATHCFTAGYGRIYHRSTGSLLLVKGSQSDLERGGAALGDLPLDRSDMGLYEHQLRRFRPDELLRLFGFVDAGGDAGDDAGGDAGGDAGDDAGGDAYRTCSTNNKNNNKRGVFQIPSAVVPSLEQRYKLIGNSVSVNVITELLRELLLSA